MCEKYQIIAYYQQTLKSCKDDAEVYMCIYALHCIGKLFELQITVEHLQKTGIGKTVNSLRRYDGEVGAAAKTLVAKWKAMVAAREMSSKRVEKDVLEDDHLRKTNREFKSKNGIHSCKHNATEKKKSATSNEKKIPAEDKFTGILSDMKKHKRKGQDCTIHNHDSKSYFEANQKKDVDSCTLKSINISYRDLKRGKNDSSIDHINSTSPAIKRKKNLLEEGIDSSMGASFSDALGMCSMTTKKKKKGRGYQEKAIIKHDTSKESEINVKAELLDQLPKDELDISLYLPLETQVLSSADMLRSMPYSRHALDCTQQPQSKEKASFLNSDALSIGISSKSMRTKVYSGIKTGAILIVPSLFDICVRVLQKNFDALEYTGGVPFDVLRPVLNHTTPEQLLCFEDYNPYLLEDTDVLWQRHVGRRFRGETRHERETWREMFLRCEAEKERRLNILTNNIKISQKQIENPMRKTRLAYVDNVVKPPRNIQRKQEQFKTNGKFITSPAARIAALTSISHNVVKAGDPRLKVSRDVILSSGNNQYRSKRAPLMAKTLQFIKKTYKK